MKINRQAVANLLGNAKITFQNRIKHSNNIACTIVMPTTVQTYPAYAYVPYNRKWGNMEVNHRVSIELTSGGFGVVSKENASPELLNAIYKCLGESKVKSSKYDTVTFQLEYKNGEIVIDRTSFAFYKKKKSSLGDLETVSVSLPVTIFMSPDGQRWVNEKSYADYASNMRIVYQCSDDTIAHSYQGFKDWECELAYHPNNPVYLTYSECDSSLSSIGYLELESDGTIWRSQAMLEEYIHWQQNPEYGMNDGIYVGSYGTANNFVDYSSLYNVAYYANAGLKREEQFYGAYGFLYSNSEQALKSIDKLNSFQKVKK